MRSAVLVDRGGVVDVRGCAFEMPLGNDVAFRLAADTTGAVWGNTVVGSLWGRVAPPAGMDFVDGGGAPGEAT